MILIHDFICILGIVCFLTSGLTAITTPYRQYSSSFYKTGLGIACFIYLSQQL